MASFYGGTGLLIAVSVAFDLVQKIDSHLVMRNYRGPVGKRLDVPSRLPAYCVRTAIRPIPGGMTKHADGFHRSARGRQRHAGRAAGQDLRIPHLSTGDMLRRPPATPRPTLGLKADKYMSPGKLVPDDVDRCD